MSGRGEGQGSRVCRSVSKFCLGSTQPVVRTVRQESAQFCAVCAWELAMGHVTSRELVLFGLADRVSEVFPLFRYSLYSCTQVIWEIFTSHAHSFKEGLYVGGFDAPSFDEFRCLFGPWGLMVTCALVSPEVRDDVLRALYLYEGASG